MEKEILSKPGKFMNNESYQYNKFDSELSEIKTSLRSLIKVYKRNAKEIENYLLHRPCEWGKFQNRFNSEVNDVFREIMYFEKESLSNNCGYKLDKLKKIFIKKIRDLFLKSEYFERSLRKPFGYAGDFKIIDDMYQNNPKSLGFNRLFDNYFQMAGICTSVRNRKEDFKRLIAKFIADREEQSLRIMNLGSGPCRELKELFLNDGIPCKNITIDCYDNDENAIGYAKSLTLGIKNINFFKENALRLAATRNIKNRIVEKYDLIYAMGIFDYFNHKISVRLVSNLKNLLKKDGVLVVSNVRDRYSNPSIHCMEWVGEWILIYRNEEEFNKIFIEAGFHENDLKIEYEQQGIMQYMIANNRIK